MSEPFLTPETIRYQSTLLYVSLIFVSVSLFQLGNIKIGENLVSVNRRLLVIYTIFIALITLIFLIKAYVDTQRALFARNRNDEVVNELRQFMAVGLQKKHIQEYFWLEVFDVIGRAYKTYADAASEAVNASPTFEHNPMNVLNLDRDSLCGVPELATEIAAQDKRLTVLTAELKEDETRFLEKAKRILSEARSQRQDDPYTQLRSDSYERMTKAYDECLCTWFEARNKLTDEHLSQKLKEMANNPEQLQLNAMVTVMKHILKIRRIYAALEIFAPVTFAFGVILYVWLR